MRSQDGARIIIDAIPWLHYAGLPMENALDRIWNDVVHPDLIWFADYCRSILVSGEPGEIEARRCRFDGEYRRFFLRASPFRTNSGTCQMV